MIGPEKAAGGLAPEGEMFRSGEVPSEDDGVIDIPGEGAAYGVEGGALLGSAGRVCAEGFLELGSVGLPEGKELAGHLEVTAEGTVTVAGGKDLSDLNAGHEELEVVAVFGEALAPLNDGSDLEGKVVGAVLMKRRCVAALYGLRGGDASGGKQEGEGADCGRSDALRAVSQSRSPRVAEESRR